VKQIRLPWLTLFCNIVKCSFFSSSSCCLWALNTLRLVNGLALSIIKVPIRYQLKDINKGCETEVPERKNQVEQMQLQSHGKWPAGQDSCLAGIMNAIYAQMPYSKSVQSIGKRAGCRAAAPAIGELSKSLTRDCRGDLYKDWHCRTQHRSLCVFVQKQLMPAQLKDCMLRL